LDSQLDILDVDMSMISDHHSKVLFPSVVISSC